MISASPWSVTMAACTVGECFDVLIGSRWVPTRIEMDDRWYLVGVKTDQLAGLRVRM